MAWQRVLRGLPLRVNRFILVIVIVLSVVSGLSSSETLRLILAAVGGALTLVALGPFVFKLIWEYLSKGKAHEAELSELVPDWRQLCKSMGIRKDVKVKSFPNLRNAAASGTTILIGRPILDSLDNIETKAVLVHELTHIRDRHQIKRTLLMAGVVGSAVLALFLLLAVLLRLGLSVYYLSEFSLLGILLCSFGLSMPHVCWPMEYSADLAAKQYVSKDAMSSALRGLAELRDTPPETDSYTHPSVNKRIARLDRTR